MSLYASFDVYFPIVVAEIEQNSQALLRWSLLIAFFGALVIWPFKMEAGMPKLPIAMKEEFPSRKKRIDIFIKDTRRLLIDSCNKV